MLYLLGGKCPGVGNVNWEMSYGGNNRVRCLEGDNLDPFICMSRSLCALLGWFYNMFPANNIIIIIKDSIQYTLFIFFSFPAPCL